MKPRLATLSSPSFALISVLALVSLAALTATAFLASARLDRQATRSLGETTRLEMACTSARECASQTLNIMCEPKWQTIATYWRGTNATDWTNEVGYLLLGRPNSAANVRWTYFCGFNPAPHKKLDTNTFLIEGTNITPGSYLTEIGSFMATMTNGFVTNPASTDTNCTRIPLLGGRTSPPVGWTYIYQDKKIANSTNTTNVPVARFSYYMEDLTGLIDAERMGGTTRSTGTNASEICLTNLTTNWNSGSIINATNYSLFTNPVNRAKYFSPALLLYANSNISTNDLRYFAHGLLSWSNFPNNIPVGIAITNSKGYGQGDNNTLKFTLNSSGNLVLSNIYGMFISNVPSWTNTTANRAGGMTPTTYVSNIAANIVDLFDADNLPTTSTNAGANIRGIESYPFVNEIWDRYELTNWVTTPTNNRLTVSYDLKITTWIELWNMSAQAVTNGTLRIIYKNRESMTNMTGGTNIPVTFTQTLSYFTNVDLVFTNTTATPSNLTNCGIPAMAFHMIPLPTYITNFTTTITNATTITNNTNLVLLWRPNGNSNGYAAYYAATSNSMSLPSNLLSHPTQVDASSTSFSGIQRNTNTPTIHYLSPSQTVWWRGNATPNSDLTLGLAGDPRMSFFLSSSSGQTWFDHQFEAGRASWWARNTLGAGASSYSVDLSKWPETSHNATAFSNITNPAMSPSNSTLVSRLQSTNGTMAQVTYNQLPTNIIQLGQVFDPMQWQYNITLNPAGVPVTGATASPASGGGNTLRIGRPEHPRFAFTNLGGTYPVPNMGLAAAALLDIFSVSNSYDTGGKINLNTAPAPVLRALAGGVILSNDTAMTPFATLAIPATMTEAFAQGVMRYRSVYPFLSSSQLAFIATDYGITNSASTHWTNTWPTNAVFGNTNPAIPLTNAPGNTLGTTASIGVSSWNDQAAEEWFSKIYNLSTVQSWNYRTYVVAQLVGTNGLPTGPTMRKYSLMYIRYNNPFSSGISAGPFMSFESPY
jgi:hypothetical protein